ncbi:hypothetical protein, conserved [Eimeria tenella]|uniref:PHD-type domain-containing protein n=1 Tax=Eimeria tenella TaxID=5802 RepID=U6KYM6_EIMTE|nr:hypothetical protein, conserved [Eimeria tenella]CDJ43066.1 hypothetical protein, conserved [Eimeria tenella]|eukprot:XP_013233816.1 hypothetical protein, conserved [Eimeria tenella]
MEESNHAWQAAAPSAAAAAGSPAAVDPAAAAAPSNAAAEEEPADAARAATAKSSPRMQTRGGNSRKSPAAYLPRSSRRSSSSSSSRRDVRRRGGRNSSSSRSSLVKRSPSQGGLRPSPAADVGSVSPHSTSAAAATAAAAAEQRSTKVQQRVAAAQLFWCRIAEELAEAPGKCDVCGGAESTEENAILFCDACDVPVHLHCYGLDSVPPGDWYCDFCLDALEQEAAAAAAAAAEAAADAAAEATASAPAGPSAEDNCAGGETIANASSSIKRSSRRSRNSSSSSSSNSSSSKNPHAQEDAQVLFPRWCCLCPRRSGALIRALEGPWVHASCALWLPEVETVPAAAAAAVPVSPLSPTAKSAAAAAAAASAAAAGGTSPRAAEDHPQDRGKHSSNSSNSSNSGVPAPSPFLGSSGGRAPACHSPCAGSSSSSSSSGRLRVAGCGGVSDERFEGRCALCCWTGGALLQCVAAGCSNKIHPVCCRLFACGPDLCTQSEKLLQGRRETLVALCPEHEHLHTELREAEDTPQGTLRLHPVSQLWQLLKRSGDALQVRAAVAAAVAAAAAASVQQQLMQLLHQLLLHFLLHLLLAAATLAAAFSATESCVSLAMSI